MPSLVEQSVDRQSNCDSGCLHLDLILGGIFKAIDRLRSAVSNFSDKFDYHFLFSFKE